jgi:hypothetical protein
VEQAEFQELYDSDFDDRQDPKTWGSKRRRMGLAEQEGSSGDEEPGEAEPQMEEVRG